MPVFKLLIVLSSVYPCIAFEDVTKASKNLSIIQTASYTKLTQANTTSFYKESMAQTKVATESSVVRDQSNLTYQTVGVDYKSLPEYKAYIFIINYYNYITSVPGLFTNPLVVYVSLKSRPFSPSKLHMFVLGVTDFLVVSTRIIPSVFDHFMFQWTDASCKILYYLINVCYLFSNWILVSWTLERFIAVIFPMKLNVWCTVPTMKKVLCVCCALSFITLTPQITECFSVLSVDRTRSLCTYSAFYFQIYSHFENIVYMYIPMILITGCNFAIVFKLHQQTPKRIQFTSDQEILKKRAQEQRQLSRVLLTVSSMFIFFHSTQLLAKMWQAIYPNSTEILKHSVRNYIRFNLFLMVGYRTTDFQNSINFFLYCAFGSKVRQILRDALCRKKKQQSALFVLF